MATQNELIDPLLNKRQKENQARQLPQTGLNPAQGVANAAAGIGDGIQSGIDSVQRGLAQQGRAINAVASGAGDAVVSGFNALNRGDPVRDTAEGIASGFGKVGDFFKNSAALARTGDQGQMIPGERNGDIPGRLQAIPQPAQAIAQSNSTPSAPIVPAAVAAPIQQQPVIAATGKATETGGYLPSKTGSPTEFGSNDKVPSSTRPAPAPIGIASIKSPFVIEQSPVQSAASAAAANQISEHNRLMDSTPGNGIGAGMVARGALNKAKVLSGIDTEQQQSATSAFSAKANADSVAKNTGIAAFNAQSQDAARQDASELHRAQLDEQKRHNKIRDDLMALDDSNDPGGAKRAALKNKLQMLTGKENDHYTPIVGKDEMGNSQVIGIFNKQTGSMVDPSGQPVKSKQDISRAHNDAQAAIAKGMDKNEVNRRLLAAGIPAL